MADWLVFDLGRWGAKVLLHGASSATVTDDQPVGEGLVVFTFNSDNEITHQWISGDLRSE